MQAGGGQAEGLFGSSSLGGRGNVIRPGHPAGLQRKGRLWRTPLGRLLQPRADGAGGREQVGFAGCTRRYGCLCGLEGFPG
eukprot:3737110-Lingulodinium_polyedra.AAC.1